MDELKKEVYKLRKELRAKEKQLLEAERAEREKNQEEERPAKLIVIVQAGETYGISRPVDADEHSALFEELQMFGVNHEHTLNDFVLSDLFDDGKVEVMEL